MLSSSQIRFSPTVAEAIDILDEDELEEVTQAVAREREDGEDELDDEDDEEV
jgi:hypothetical protein